MANCNQKLVSLLIPVYNHKDYIADCLESILAQTYSNIELIICDDCSNHFEELKGYLNEPKLFDLISKTVLL